MRKDATLFMPAMPGRLTLTGSADEQDRTKPSNAAVYHDPLKTRFEVFQTPILSAVQAEELRLKATLAGQMATRAEDNSTERLKSGAADVMSILTSLPSSGVKVGEAATYARLPKKRAVTDVFRDISAWRIELHGLGRGVGPLGIDVAGDIVIGRGPDADLDLDPYKGYEQAVSRRHAMLRPSARHLHLIDLGSTNGTLTNTIPLSRCSAYALNHNDVITLGLLTLTIKLIDGPMNGKG